MKVLIDANVILDVLLNRSPWVADSQAVWEANHQQQIQGQIVATSVTNLFYIARKLVGQPLALQGVRDRLAAFDVIPVNQTILHDATALPGSDFEDNVTIRCAVVSGTEAIVTRNLADFSDSPVPAFWPAELLSRLRAESP
jgi:predicted nucleic acid-binding protein